MTLPKEIKVQGHLDRLAVRVAGKYQDLPEGQQEHLNELYRNIQYAERQYYQAEDRGLSDRDLRESERHWEAAKNELRRYEDKYFGKEASVRTAARYWHGTEEIIEGHMGLADLEYEKEYFIGQIAEKAGISDAIPESVGESAFASYLQTLYEKAPDPDNYLEAVKSAVEAALTDMLKEEPAYNEEHIISSIGDNYAHEEIFGAIGGVPEYNFQADNEMDVEELTGKPADDVWEALDSAAQNAGQGDWSIIEEDIAFAWSEALGYAAEVMKDEYEEYLEEEHAVEVMKEEEEDDEEEPPYVDPQQTDLKFEGRARRRRRR